jgi:hypothetical protein
MLAEILGGHHRSCSQRDNRKRIAVVRERLDRGEPVVAMYGPLRLAWLQRQGETAEQLIAARTATPLPPDMAGSQ